MKSKINPIPLKKAPVAMKKITNVSLQAWSIPLLTPQGLEGRYIEPRHSIVVPASYITDTAIRYQDRQLIAIKNA